MTTKVSEEYIIENNIRYLYVKANSSSRFYAINWQLDNELDYIRKFNNVLTDINWDNFFFKTYYFQCKKHNLYGPAIITNFYSPTIEYYINGVSIKYNDFIIHTKPNLKAFI